MVSLARTFAILVVFFVWLAKPALAQFSFPDYDNIYINDDANIIDFEVENRLKAYLIEAEANGTQITVVTIDQLSSFNAGPAIEPFATALFNHWGVGDASKNNGVLVLVARLDRKMRIEIGSGYTSLWDGKMKRIIDNVFIPYFKNDDYSTGIEQGVLETIKEVTGQYPSAESGLVNSAKRTVTSWWHKLGGWLLAILAPIIFAFISLVRFIRRRIPRDCDRCGNKMNRLDEQSDDEHIDGGQRLEEYLDSVDYDVWQCSRCMHINLHRYVSFFSSYETCPQCNYKTVDVETTILEPATTSSSGLKRLDYQCKHCDYTDTETRTIPRKSESSSSSGSFGGGSSSGGGASGSW